MRGEPESERTYTAIGVHDFGGGFALGVVQAGWKLEAKFSRHVGFGVLNCMANRDLLGYEWGSVASLPHEWDVMNADLVFGNPPCSGFSTLTDKRYRGEDAAVNEYMWELIRYAAKVKPKIVIFESVQTTFRQGLGLLRQLHEYLVEFSGLPYTLHHVLHNGMHVGGAANRPRYYWVASLVPFGVGQRRITRDGTEDPSDIVIPDFDDILRDLTPLGMTLRDQPYPYTECECDGSWAEPPYDYHKIHTCVREHRVHVRHGSDWCANEVYDGTGIVDGHDIVRSPMMRRAMELILSPHNPKGVPWPQHTGQAAVAQAYYLKNGDLPKSWHYGSNKPVMEDTGEMDDEGQPIMKQKMLHGRRVTEKVDKVNRIITNVDPKTGEWRMGHNQLFRWRGDRPARVITGGGCHLILHPTLDRTITQREAARIQGFPDDWKIWPVRNAGDLGPGWGKGVPVQTGRWIAYWALQALQRGPGPLTGVNLAEYSPLLFSGKGDVKGHGPRTNEWIIDARAGAKIKTSEGSPTE